PASAAIQSPPRRCSSAPSSARRPGRRQHSASIPTRFFRVFWGCRTRRLRSSTIRRSSAGQGSSCRHMPAAAPRTVVIELNAVLVALIADEPQVLTLEDGTLLPSGPFESDHPTLQTGVRAWVERQTHHPLGYVEQLYTFADRNRAEAQSGRRIV